MERNQLTRCRYFHEKLIYMHQYNGTKMKMVSFDEYSDALGTVVYYKLCEKTYKPEDFCFMEMEEGQFSLSSGTACLPLRSKEKSYRILSVVTYNSRRDKHTIYKFLQKAKIGQDRTQINSALSTLSAHVMKAIGSLHYWFVEMISEEENVSSAHRRVRFVITAHNMSLIDQNWMPIIHPVLQENQFDVDFDADKKTLTVRIIHNETGITKIFKVRSRLGEEIGIKLLQAKALTDSTPSPCMPPNSVSTSNSAVVAWLRNSREEPSSSDMDEPVESDLNYILSPPPDIEPPLPHVPTPRPSLFIQGSFPPRPHRHSPTEHDERSASCPQQRVVPKLDSGKVLVLPKGHLIRSESINDILLQSSREMHIYVNVAHRNNLCEDDNPYYSVYYSNIGWIRYRKTSMADKIQRRTRLSDALEEVDFLKVDQHEQWYDTGFMERNHDARYRRLSQTYVKEVFTPNGSQIPLNIPPDYSPEPQEIRFDSSDTYWNSDLCLSIQMLLEQRKPNLAYTFDLTFEQMVGICVNLSVEKTVTAKDWRHIAGLLGLSGSDIEVIQHYCYTYREWTTSVVLCHWIFLQNAGKNVPACSHDNLKCLVKQIGRDDLLQIFHSDRINQQLQINLDDEETWL